MMKFYRLLAVITFIAVFQTAKGQTDGSAAGKPSTAGAKELNFDDNDTYVFSEGMCAVKRSNLWGFIDSTGTQVIDCQFYAWDALYQPHFSSGIALVAIQGDAGRVPVFIDKKGQQLFKSQVFSNATQFYDGMAIVEKTNPSTRQRTFHIINKQGQVIPGSITFGNPPGYFHSLEPFRDGLTKLYNAKTSSYGFINNQGKWVVQPNPDFLETGHFSNGLAPVQSRKNFYWGYINNKGEVKVSFNYEKKPGDFSEGVAAVRNNDKVGYIDGEGKTVIDFPYFWVFPVNPENDGAGPFINGHAVVYAEDDISGYCIIDKSGKIIRRLGPDKIEVWDNGWIYVKDIKTDAIGIVTTDGRDVLLPGYFTWIGEFKDGFAYATASIDEQKVTGFVNRNFDFVIIKK